MLIKQIIEFELRGSGPLKFEFNNTFTRTCTPISGYFHEKTKIYQKNLRVNYYLLLKYCKRQCTLISPTWAQSLRKFNPEGQDFKRVLDLKKGLNNLIFQWVFKFLKSSSFKWH